MKTKVFVFFLSFFSCYSYTGSAQSNMLSTSKGNSLITGMLTFSSQGGELYQGNFTYLSASSKYHYFLVDKFGVGMNVSYGKIFSTGDNNFTTWSIGPNLKYFFDKGNNTVPYLGAGVNLINRKSDELKQRLFQTNIGGGLAVFKNKFAMLYEVGVDLDRFKNDNGETIKGYTFYISFGAAVSLSSNKKN